MEVYGFTGTRHGMTQAQEEALRALLKNWHVQELHHGDCIGADATADRLAKELGIRRVGHPPDKPIHRAYCEVDRSWPEKPYLIRNREIVDTTDRLIATPRGNNEQLRSGTWATIRYALSVKKSIFIIRPDGHCESK